MALFGKKKPAAKTGKAKTAKPKSKASSEAAAIAKKMKEKSKNGECAFC